MCRSELDCRRKVPCTSSGLIVTRRRVVMVRDESPCIAIFPGSWDEGARAYWPWQFRKIAKPILPGQSASRLMRSFICRSHCLLHRPPSEEGGSSTSFRLVIGTEPHRPPFTPSKASATARSWERMRYAVKSKPSFPENSVRKQVGRCFTTECRGSSLGSGGIGWRAAMTVDIERELELRKTAVPHRIFPVKPS